MKAVLPYAVLSDAAASPGQLTAQTRVSVPRQSLSPQHHLECQNPPTSPHQPQSARRRGVFPLVLSAPRAHRVLQKGHRRAPAAPAAKPSFMFAFTSSPPSNSCPCGFSYFGAATPNQRSREAPCAEKPWQTSKTDTADHESRRPCPGLASPGAAGPSGSAGQRELRNNAQKTRLGGTRLRNSSPTKMEVELALLPDE